MSYSSKNLVTFPRARIQPITNKFPNNTGSPFFGEEKIKPLATVRVRRVGVRGTAEPNQRCESSSVGLDNIGRCNLQCCREGGCNLQCCWGVTYSAAGV